MEKKSRKLVIKMIEMMEKQNTYKLIPTLFPRSWRSWQTEPMRASLPNFFL
jgi:hypothetical protein